MEQDVTGNIMKSKQLISRKRLWNENDDNLEYLSKHFLLVVIQFVRFNKSV